MAGPNQNRILLMFAENAPTIAFLFTLQITGELRIAGWVGAVASALTFAAFYRFGLSFHPILLAVNLYLLLVTPVIETVYLLELQALGKIMVANTQVGVLLSIFIVGSFLTVFSQKGFIGVACDPHSRTLRLSLILLAASAAAVVWSAVNEGNRVMAIALPLAALFGLRELLLAGLKDRGVDAGD